MKMAPAEKLEYWLWDLLFHQVLGDSCSNKNLTDLVVLPGFIIMQSLEACGLLLISSVFLRNVDPVALFNP